MQYMSIWPECTRSALYCTLRPLLESRLMEQAVPNRGKHALKLTVSEERSLDKRL